MEENNKYIEEFVCNIKNKYDNLVIGYDYYKSKELENKMNKYIFDIIEPKQIEYEYTEINNLPDYISNVDTNIDLQLKMSSMKINFDYVELKYKKNIFQVSRL